jgi:diguanylate cyclase (GGDEF)-like protein
MIVTHLLSCVILLTCPLLAVALWFCTPARNRHEVIRWSAAIATGGFAFLMFGLIGIAPDWLTLPLGNAASTATIMLCALVIINFEKHTVSHNWWIVPTVVAAIVVFILLPTQLAREIAEALWYSSAMLVVACKVWRISRISTLTSYWLVVVGSIAASLVLILRVVFDWTRPTPYVGYDWHMVLTFISAYVIATSWTIGYMMLLRDKAEVQLETFAMTDPLTGIHNRRMFFELAEAEFRKARRARTSITLLMIDIDHFKAVNDRHGHVVGDQVLRHVADTIGNCLRSEDVFVRYCGEEFGVMVTTVTEEHIRQLSERIRLAVERAPYVTEQSKPISLSVSVGACRAVPSAAISLEHLLARADASVYQAKRDGRNRVVLHNVA